MTLNGDRLLARLDELRAIGATERGGVTRLAFGPEDLRARALVGTWLIEAGLAVEVDAAANLIGRLRGSEPTPRAIAIGSHLDTVVDAGPYDGAYGVVAALEVAAAVSQGGEPLRHDLLAVAIANEEGARGTDGMTGSRALIGGISAEELARPDAEDVALSSRIEAAGGAPTEIATAAWDPALVAAFMELHVEQGPVLESGDEVLGVVTGFTGRRQVDIHVHGDANHAGTTPMALRRDASTAAAEVILAIEELGRSGAVRVATCGTVGVGPNVRNVVPGRVMLGAELRDLDPDVLASASDRLARTVADIAERRDLRIEMTWGQLLPPVVVDPGIADVLAGVARASGHPWRELPSGAGHDAQILGGAVPVGMLFVPSVGGVSHSPREHTEPHHLVAGAEALLAAVRELDRRLSA